MRIDYDDIAARYDQHRRGTGAYQKRLVELAATYRPRRVLELGAGTGNSAASFLKAYPCKLIALELSQGMIAEARRKGVAARWIRGSALQIPVATGRVGYVFGVYVLHHLNDLDAVCQECARVIRQGPAAFVTASTEFIERHPMNRYFPSFAAIDKARFQPVRTVQAALGRAGFGDVGVEYFLDAPRPINKAYADQVASKFVSTYELIPPDEFASGLERLYADIEAKGCLDEPMEWESVTVWGVKQA